MIDLLSMATMCICWNLGKQQMLAQNIRKLRSSNKVCFRSRVCHCCLVVRIKYGRHAINFDVSPLQLNSFFNAFYILDLMKLNLATISI